MLKYAYSSLPSSALAITMWSSIVIPISLEASHNRVVVSTSSLDKSKLPDG